MDKCVEVIVSGAGVMMEAWCAAWVRSGNKMKVRFFHDGSWSDEERRVCEAVGSVESAERVYDVVRKAMPAGTKTRRVGWMAKPLIMMQARSEYAVWLDHDVEVQGDLAPMVEFVRERGAWFASPVYATFCRLYLDTRVAQHGVIVYKPGDSRMQAWSEYALGCGNPNDEENFADAFGGVAAARVQVLDLYRPEWYETPDSVPYRRLLATAPRLAASTAATVHWASPTLKGPMREHVLEHGGTEAACQDDRKAACQDDRERDAVFVLGRGSRARNLELRLALRSMAMYCPWIRHVWIVGEPVPWVSDAVRQVRCKDKYRHCKDANIVHKIRVAAEQPGMAREFLWCCDDQLVVKPSAWEDFEPRWLRVYSASDTFYEQGENRKWRQRLRATLERFGEGAKYFQPHIWAPVERDKFLKMCEGVDYATSEAVTVMSLYYNWIKAEGEKNFDHAFVRRLPLPDVRHIAYDDKGFNRRRFREDLLKRFRQKCKWEK